ncbi:MAG TPA: MG2 domain-containing protein [Vicinamibacterales bacterium]|nr:MG2 domain-containing protein [Vicinamibacterales bacterium]
MRRFVAICVCLLLLGAGAVAALPPAALTVVSAGPNGEIRQLSDANEIRVIFSEPMIALGRTPSNPTPPWIRISPAIAGTWRWSGTTILIFTPDPATPLPFATRYTITIDAAAESAAGQRLGAPFAFTFTTPTVRLVSARWARQDGRFDRPLALALEFNQPVRATDVVAHLGARYRRHDVAIPSFSNAERARIAAADPNGLTRFDTKVAFARQQAARTDALALRQAAVWDRERFPPSDTLVVLETTVAPPPGTEIQLTLDTRMPSPAGPEFPPEAQTSLIEPDPVFFAIGSSCRAQCNPSAYNSVHFSNNVDASRFAAALRVRDITTPAREQAIAAASPPPAAGRDISIAHSLDDAGFDRQPPARTWALHLDPALEAADGQRLDYPWVAIVENWHERAFASFGDGHGVWETSGGRQLPFYSRNFRTVTQHLSRLTPRELMPRILELQQNNFRLRPPGTGTVRRLNVTDDAIQSHGLDVNAVLSPQGTGLAWAAIEPGEPIPRSSPIEHAGSTVVQVTNLGITVKDSPQSTLVFVTRLDNGEPVDAARVTIINTRNEEVWAGSTGRDGVVIAPAMPLRSPENWYELSFIVTAEKDGDVGYVASNWNEGISPWEFDTSYGLWEATDILRGSVFSDRGVYKPGEEVHVKALVRLDTPNGMRLMPGGSALDVRVTDTRGKEVDRRRITVNKWSSAEWSWTVPESATLGNYWIQVEIPGTTKPEGNDVTERRRGGEWLKRVGGSFLVAAYRKPDFRVDATLTATSPVAGSALRGAIDARYLFGNAMRGRPVSWSIRREPTFDVPQPILAKFPTDKYSFGYYPDARPDGTVKSDKATTDADGKIAVEVTAEANTDLTYFYTFEADVEDVSRQHVAARASTVVYPAPWHIGVRRPPYFADVSTGTAVDVVAVDPSGNLVKGVPVKISLVRIQWNSVRRAEGSGFYEWDTERVEVPSGEWTITSDSAPVTVKIPLPEGGSYELQAIATQDGRRARTDTSFYALGKGYTAWQRFDHNRITLEPEKKSWKPGERARLMIQSPWESATALLTMEREGIRRYERFTLTSTQQTVEVPITEEDIPNVFVSVLLIRGRTSNEPGPDGSDPGKPAFKLGYAELDVEDASKRLEVTVAADRPEYRPANSAKVSVAVTDPLGKPARGEVTLWAVDYGVLSLTGYQAPDVRSAVYRRKSLQVMNEDSRQRIISRRVLTPKGDSEGGGGGSENIRSDFRPLAFWLGSVETDGSGKATRTVTLPDALTTYRIMAVASDTASRFGDGSTEIRVSKPVTMLAAFPRFLTTGDRASFGSVITNTLASGGRATVTIKSLDPGVLAFAGSSSQTLDLDGGGTEPVRFDAEAISAGVARVQMTVKLGGNSDAFEATIPVQAPARAEVVAAFGDTDSRTSERIALPADVVASTGGLEISFASSALVGLGEGVRYLAEYGYFCAEQKASAALALSLAADLGTTFSMSRIAPADYRKKAASLLAELPRYQCADGGFGYWPGNCRRGDTYLTSYVLHVMFLAKELGFDQDAQVVNQALDFLTHKMNLPEPQQVQWLAVWGATEAFGVKVLTEYGRNQDSNITRLFRGIDRLPIFAQSYLADAVRSSRPDDPRYPDLVRRLTNAMRVEGDRAHVEELDEEALAWIWSSNVRATAIVLDGLVRRGDDPVFVQRAVRWILGDRENGRWRNTQENAMALAALVAYYKKFEAETPNFTATAAIDNRTIGTARFSGRATSTQSVRLAMPDLLRQVAAGTEKELAISRAGAGRLYYASRLQFVPRVPPPASDQGIHVERRYERFVENGDSPAATSFAAGDLIRVTLTVTLPKERRYVAVTDAMPAGVEAVDGWFRTTASDLAADASQQSDDGSWDTWWRRGGFDHVEKYDDRVQLFATRLGEGRHQFSYLVRATTSGTFTAAGTWAEEMYTPEVSGRTAPATIVIK